MKISALKSSFLAAFVAGTFATANAQVAAPSSTPKPAPAHRTYDEWEKQVKNPVDWFTWGADLRLRNEYLNNAITLNKDADRHEQDYFRFRERIWASLIPAPDLSINARASGEQRVWMEHSFAGAYGRRSGLEERYLILDNANIKLAKIDDLPLSISIGRQDILLGDPLNWWLVADGTPGDGSWSFFLDSVRVGYDAKDIKTKFDLIYIYQSALPDDWIPTIGRSGDNTPARYNLTEQDEQGVIVYASNKSIKKTQIDGYFIYKHDTPISEIGNGDNADIYTAGAKVTGSPGDHWAYSVEGAYQFGWKQDPTFAADPTASRSISAYGGNAKVNYLFKDKLKNQVGLAFEYLSGDDPDSGGQDEMFDLLWGRWPRWSELYIYSYILETSGKIAQMNNLIRVGPTWTINPTKGMTISAAYNALFAPQDTPTRTVAPALFSNDDHFRGHYLQANIKHVFNAHVSAHLWSEFVWMGDYYANKDMMTFLRAEVLLTF